MENEFKLTIDSLVYEGFGLGRLPDGKAVFIPFVLPGEEVIAGVIEEKPGHVRARLLSVVKPHAKRIKPRCGHFGYCGGCHYQHIPYELQLQFKEKIFREQLQRIAGLNDPTVSLVIPSKEKWNYRNSLTFELDRGGKLCFSDIYHNQSFAVTECHLPMAEIGRVWQLAEFEPGVDVRRVEYRQNKDGSLMMVLQGGGVDMPELSSEATLSIVHTQNNEEVVIAGDGFLNMPVSNREFIVSANSFFQTNFSGAEALVEKVVEIIQLKKPEHLLDVYCGVGLFSAFFADQVKTISAIEFSPSACSDFSENLDEFDNISLFQGKAEQIMPYLDADFDCILVDPPRAGLKKDVVSSIITRDPELLIYVSCNPSTLARDTKFLATAGYRLDSSILVDMFPLTFHIESINVFKK
jgi:23S rRNA (uracil1939-C5)-methyltransferase